jgi:Rrf2 family nitric oxide-sensitive transcriptional repressor
MQLNAFTDYACRVLVFAAVRKDRCTSEQIATAFGISRHHVIKVVNGLRHLGYLETSRGRTGGLRLALPPDQICIGEVVRRAEGSLAIVECFDRERNGCPLTRACGLKGILGEAFDAFFAVLERYTVADLIAEPRWVAKVATLVPAERHVHV